MPYGKDIVNILGGSATSAKSFASREWLPVAALQIQNILLMGGRKKTGDDMLITDMTIDWKWVEKTLLEKERIMSSATNAISKSARGSVDRAKDLAEPKAIFLKKALRSFDNGRIKLAGGVEFSGRILSSYINSAHHIYVFLVTIGSPLEDEASGLMKRGESLSGYLLDRVGSFAVESLANTLGSRILKKDGPKGKNASMPFSPGYCDWPIEEQVKLDMLLDFSRIGVHLTESCMMTPRKSISGLIGIGPAKLYSKVRPKCGVCKMKGCGYRKI